MQNTIKNDYSLQKNNKIGCLTSQKDNSRQKNTEKLFNVKNYTIGNATTIENTNQNDEMDIEEEEEEKVVKGFDLTSVSNLSDENNTDDILKDTVPQSCMNQFKNYYGNQEGRENNLVKQLDSYQEKLDNVNDTEIKSKNKNNEENSEENDDENEMVIEKENQNVNQKNTIQKKQGKIFNVIIPQLPRMFTFNEAKNVLYNKCGANTLDSIKKLLKPLGIDENLLFLTTNDKFGYSFKKNRDFFLKEIGDLIINSFPKNMKKPNKVAKKAKIVEILEKEMNDETREIKVINAIFHLLFLDFLYAFLYDRAEIIIKNDNNKTKVIFYRSEQKPDQPYYEVKFVTYKDCFNDIYTQNQKEFYKDQIILLIKGTLHGRTTNK